MLKTLIVFVVGAAALTAAAPEDSSQIHPSVVYLEEANFEAPLNCQGSPATNRASTGKEACLNLFSGGSGIDQEDLVSECACALSHHNIWYKRIANEQVKRVSQLADRAIIGTMKRLKNLPLNGLVLINGFNDRVDYLKELESAERSQLKKEVQTELGKIMNAFSKEYRNYEAYTEQVNEKGRQMAEGVCKELTKSSQWSTFIKPSLNAIERSTYGGRNLRHALVVTQPELDQLVGLENLCQNVIFKE